MKTKLISLLAFAIFVIVILITCKKTDPVLPPVAKAGPDLVITLPTDSVLLDGTASSNPNGPITKWLWTKLEGPATFIISNSSAAKTSVKNLVAGIYKFELKVTNNSNLSAVDEIVITVIAQNPAPGSPLGPPPVAIAGTDTTIKLLSCGAKGSATLDGSHSSDSLNSITGYLWSQISGPSNATLGSRASSITKADNLSIGQYVFQLQVSNANGLSSKDTMNVMVAAETTASNLDLSLSGGFTFMNNYEDCYYGPPCYYYDYTTIDGKFNLPPFGQFSFWSYEIADTASTSEVHDTQMGLYVPNNTGQGPSVSGTSSINFKKIIQKGGGTFSGTLKIEHGSAKNCNPDIYTNLDPLTVTGSIDTTARTISLAIKGKTYF